MLTSNQEFNYDEKYYYNLIFAPENFTGEVKENTPGRLNLLDQGILSTSTILNQRRKIVCYPKNPLPFFLTPRTKLGEVKMAHVSCRKPHGGEFSNEHDSFIHLDAVINKNENKRGGNDKIPQQLFMTGDQIYADDVDASLLYLIQDAIPTLYNSDYDPEDKFFNDIPKKKFDIGKRESTVNNYAKFTHSGGHAQNHLIHESEYYLMYLFVWSDVLWPDQIPSYHKIIEEKGFEFDEYYKVVGEIKDLHFFLQILIIL